MQREIPPIFFVAAIAAVVALIVFLVIKSGQLPTSGITDHTKYRAPAGLPQPPLVKERAKGPGVAIPAPQ